MQREDGLWRGLGPDAPWFTFVTCTARAARGPSLGREIGSLKIGDTLPPEGMLAELGGLD